MIFDQHNIAYTVAFVYTTCSTKSVIIAFAFGIDVEKKPDHLPRGNQRVGTEHSHHTNRKSTLIERESIEIRFVRLTYCGSGVTFVRMESTLHTDDIQTIQ